MSSLTLNELKSLLPSSSSFSIHRSDFILLHAHTPGILSPHAGHSPSAPTLIFRMMYP
jgi:hypothetical protein